MWLNQLQKINALLSELDNDNVRVFIAVYEALLTYDAVYVSDAILCMLLFVFIYVTFVFISIKFCRVSLFSLAM